MNTLALALFVFVPGAFGANLEDVAEADSSITANAPLNIAEPMADAPDASAMAKRDAYPRKASAKVGLPRAPTQVKVTTPPDFLTKEPLAVGSLSRAKTTRRTDWDHDLRPEGRHLAPTWPSPLPEIDMMTEVGQDLKDAGPANDAEITAQEPEPETLQTPIDMLKEIHRADSMVSVEEVQKITAQEVNAAAEAEEAIEADEVDAMATAAAKAVEEAKAAAEAKALAEQQGVCLSKSDGDAADPVQAPTGDEGDGIEQKFKAAVAFVGNKSKWNMAYGIDRLWCIQIYGLFKQATEGDITTTRPSRELEDDAKAQWNAWNGYKGKRKVWVMNKYIDAVESYKRK